MTGALLNLQQCTVRFGGLTAVSAFDLQIDTQDLVGMIGPNGAGKTTVFNIITGVYDPTEGDVIFKNESIVKYKPYEVTHRGIARTFQNIRLSRSLSVRDNVRVSFNNSCKSKFFRSIFQLRTFTSEE